MEDFLLRYYWQVERVLAPGLRYSQDHYEETLRELITPSTVWLDLGCGHQVLPEWRSAAECELVNRASYVAGLDADSVAITKHRTIRKIWVGDIHNLPFPDESFMLITANMVVEHLEDPKLAFAEIRRVLVPGGTFLFHTPNANGYITALNRYLPARVKKFAAKVLDGRDSEDVYPTFLSLQYRGEHSSCRHRNRIESEAGSTCPDYCDVCQDSSHSCSRTALDSSYDDAIFGALPHKHYWYVA